MDRNIKGPYNEFGASNDVGRLILNRQVEKPIGLVFSGGGGKGSYQIGVWKAFREFDFESTISHVSGTSAGALNAWFFSMGALTQAFSVWNSILAEDILNVDTVKIGAFAARLGELSITGTLKESALHLFGRNRSDGFFSRNKLEQIIENDDVIAFILKNVLTDEERLIKDNLKLLR